MRRVESVEGKRRGAENAQLESAESCSRSARLPRSIVLVAALDDDGVALPAIVVIPVHVVEGAIAPASRVIGHDGEGGEPEDDNDHLERKAREHVVQLGRDAGGERGVGDHDEGKDALGVGQQ